MDAKRLNQLEQDAAKELGATTQRGFHAATVLTLIQHIRECQAALKQDHANDSDAWKYAHLENGDDLVLRCLAKAYRYARNGVGQNIGQYRVLIDSAIEAALTPGEPVATLIEHHGFVDGVVRFDGVENMEQLPIGAKFYTAPPAKNTA
jgi:TPR repeat protein